MADILEFQAHVPGYVDGFHKDIVRGTLTEILSDEWVARWGKDDIVAKDGHVFVRPFFRWSLSDNALMAEYDDGRYFWVVGYLQPVPTGELPQWVMHPEARTRMDRWNQGITD